MKSINRTSSKTASDSKEAITNVDSDKLNFVKSYNHNLKPSKFNKILLDDSELDQLSNDIQSDSYVVAQATAGSTSSNGNSNGSLIKNTESISVGNSSGSGTGAAGGLQTESYAWLATLPALGLMGGSGSNSFRITADNANVKLPIGSPEKIADADFDANRDNVNFEITSIKRFDDKSDVGVTVNINTSFFGINQSTGQIALIQGREIGCFDTRYEITVKGTHGTETSFASTTIRIGAQEELNVSFSEIGASTFASLGENSTTSLLIDMGVNQAFDYGSTFYIQRQDYVDDSLTVMYLRGPNDDDQAKVLSINKVDYIGFEGNQTLYGYDLRGKFFELVDPSEGPDEDPHTVDVSDESCNQLMYGYTVNETNGPDAHNYESLELIGGNGDDIIFGSYYVGNSLYGGSGDDYLMGGIGDDYLEGGVGSDTLIAGTGEDTMVGGAGIDSYVFSLVNLQNLQDDEEPSRNFIDFQEDDVIKLFIDEGVVEFTGVFAGSNFTKENYDIGTGDYDIYYESMYLTSVQLFPV
jgi:Ca2+-binding RTX toxin-like protein